MSNALITWTNASRPFDIIMLLRHSTANIIFQKGGVTQAFVPFMEMICRKHRHEQTTCCSFQKTVQGAYTDVPTLPVSWVAQTIAYNMTIIWQAAQHRSRMSLTIWQCHCGGACLFEFQYEQSSYESNIFDSVLCTRSLKLPCLPANELDCEGCSAL